MGIERRMKKLEQVGKHQNLIYWKIKKVGDILRDIERELEDLKTTYGGGKK